MYFSAVWNVLCVLYCSSRTSNIQCSQMNICHMYNWVYNSTGYCFVQDTDIMAAVYNHNWPGSFVVWDALHIGFTFSCTGLRDKDIVLFGCSSIYRVGMAKVTFAVVLLMWVKMCDWQCFRVSQKWCWLAYADNTTADYVPVQETFAAMCRHKHCRSEPCEAFTL